MKRKNILMLILVIVIAAGLMATSYMGIGKGKYGSVSQINQGLDLAGGIYIVYEADTKEITADEMSAAIAMIRERLDSKNWTDAEVSREGTNRIRVEIPGVSNAEEAIAGIGETAHLTFRDEMGSILVDGSNVTDAARASDGQQTFISLTFDAQGKKDFADATASNIGKPLYIYMDETILSAPKVQNAIRDGNAMITGNYTTEEYDALANKIRSGSLPFKLNIVNYNEVGATLGVNSLSTSVKAGAVGVLAVLVFMLIFYRVAGLAADLALIIYTGIVLVFMSLFGMTLTLPGVAGIILSIGMAVDANVIIFERIKEELNSGKVIKNALKAGFSRALPAIIDSNVTTLISCVVLLWLGTGPIKGFAQTLMLGIIVSMFTAIVVTKFILNSLINAGLKNPKLYGGR